MKPTPSVYIHCDCQSTIAIAKNKNYNGKNKHIQLKHNFVKQLLKSGTWREMGLKPLANKKVMVTQPL